MDEPEGLNWIARLQFRALMAGWRRVKELPGVQEMLRQHEEERQELRLAEPVLITARVFADSRGDDEAVAARLRRHVKNPEAARYALRELQRHRDQFDDDRAYRALYAVVHGGPVPAVEPASREKFAAQQRLSQLSLQEAFDYLAGLAPRLRALERQVTDGRLRQVADQRDIPYSGLIDERISWILRDADADADGHPILASFIATQAASLYLLVLAGEMPGDLNRRVKP
jgi:hypothetical protein